MTDKKTNEEALRQKTSIFYNQNENAFSIYVRDLMTRILVLSKQNDKIDDDLEILKSYNKYQTDLKLNLQISSGQCNKEVYQQDENTEELPQRLQKSNEKIVNFDLKIKQTKRNIYQKWQINRLLKIMLKIMIQNYNKVLKQFQEIVNNNQSSIQYSKEMFTSLPVPDPNIEIIKLNQLLKTINQNVKDKFQLIEALDKGTIIQKLQHQKITLKNKIQNLSENEIMLKQSKQLYEQKNKTITQIKSTQKQINQLEIQINNQEIQILQQRNLLKKIKENNKYKILKKQIEILARPEEEIFIFKNEIKIESMPNINKRITFRQSTKRSKLTIPLFTIWFGVLLIILFVF